MTPVPLMPGASASAPELAQLPAVAEEAESSQDEGLSRERLSPSLWKIFVVMTGQFYCPLRTEMPDNLLGVGQFTNLHPILYSGFLTQMFLYFLTVPRPVSATWYSLGILCNVTHWSHKSLLKHSFILTLVSFNSITFTLAKITCTFTYCC